MKIVVDNVIFQLQQGHPRGIARVWSNILPYMKNILMKKGHQIVLLKRLNSGLLNFGLETIDICSYENQRQAECVEMLSSTCKKLEADLFITTYHTNANDVRNLVMVHDMIPEIRKELHGDNEYVIRNRSYSKADILICVSENTKRDLHKWCPDIDVAKMNVVLEGVSSKEFYPLASDKYFVFLEKYGLRLGYMILDGDVSASIAESFCRAFSSLNSGITLFSYGGAIADHVAAACAKYKIVFLRIDWLDEKEVPMALAASKGLIFISDAEGFGLPVLEAMACSTPVLCSHKASLPEVGGDSIQYFKDYNFEDMKNSLSLFFNNENRKDLSKKGYARSKLFSWEKMAEEIVRIILKCVK